MSEPPYAPSERSYQPPLWAAPPPSTKKRKTWLIVVVVATIGLLLLIGGCLAITGSAINAADEALSETSAFLEPESSSPSPEPTTESSDEPDSETWPVNGSVKIGQTFSYEDGLRVSVVSAKKDTAGQDPIEGSPGDPTAIITIKITNGTAKKFAASDVWVDVSYDSKNGDLASPLYEYNGFGGTIPIGRSKTAKYEFLFEDKKGLNDLVIEVTPSFDHDSASFEGAAK